MSDTAVLLSNVTKRFGDFVAVEQVNLAIADGEFFSLLGPSGCGKTTTLRMVAGFEQPSEGQVYIMGQPVAGIPPNRRPVNTVFQSYALFPHMTVQQNVSFGLEMSKVAKADITRRVDAALERVQMAQFRDRKPAQLSGGQKQRIALARALVNRPKVLLLDEPLGALDLKLRKQMQLELKEIQTEVGITFIYVTHDQEEALTMSDRIAVMDKGVVRQVGSPRDIYEHPANRFVADFIGETNFIDGTIDAVDSGGTVTFVAGGEPLRGQADGTVRAGEAAVLAIRPEKVGVVDSAETDHLNTLRQANHTIVQGTVREAVYIGTDTRYRITLLGDQSIFIRVQNFGAQNMGGHVDRTFAVDDTVAVHWPINNAQILTE